MMIKNMAGVCFHPSTNTMQELIKASLALISVSQSNLVLQFKFRSWGFWFWE